MPGSTRLAAASTLTRVSWTRSSARASLGTREKTIRRTIGRSAATSTSESGRAPSSSAPAMTGTLRGVAESRGAGARPTKPGGLARHRYSLVEQPFGAQISPQLSWNRCRKGADVLPDLLSGAHTNNYAGYGRVGQRERHRCLWQGHPVCGAKLRDGVCPFPHPPPGPLVAKKP